MSRCKVCDAKMTEQELCYKFVNPITDKWEYSDLCFACSAPYEEYTEFIPQLEDEDEDQNI